MFLTDTEVAGRPDPRDLPDHGVVMTRPRSAAAPLARWCARPRPEPRQALGA